MSYILEALKKSQQERELGQVPTLAGAPHLAPEKHRRGTYWGIVSVILALLATLIALYAAFGERWLSQSDASAPVAEPARKDAPATAAPPVAAEQPVTDVEEHEPTPEQEAEPARPPATAAAPQPGKPAKPSSIAVKSGKPPTPPAAAGPAAAAPASVPLPPGAPEVPPDLVREVQRFKQELRRKKPDEPTPPTPAPPAARPVVPDPAPFEELPTEAQMPPAPRFAELPPGLQQTIPQHRVTVHVYSAAPEQRFVIINSRKRVEGERSSEGLLVEEITPDGVVLQYGGHRFFRHR